MIRPATPEDDGWIAALWSDIIALPDVTFTTVPKTPADIAAQRAAFPMLVSDHDGFATYGPFRPGPGYAACAELSIHVTAAARGRGVGRALITALEAEAQARGIDTLIAGISGANAPAIRFHSALGFAEAGRLPAVGQKGGQRFDLVLMQKLLPAHPDNAIRHG
ncbi:MAG: N-acetyltransferase family protein [Pseudomonadota bacterium]